jgi:hypothetical protein
LPTLRAVEEQDDDHGRAERDARDSQRCGVEARGILTVRRRLVDVLEGVLPERAGPCTVFIDSFGRTLSPASVVGASIPQLG